MPVSVRKFPCLANLATYMAVLRLKHEVRVRRLTEAIGAWWQGLRALERATLRGAEKSGSCERDAYGCFDLCSRDLGGL